MNKSPILKICVLFLIFLINFPQESTQQDVVQKFSIVQATCVYSFDAFNHYTCELLNASVVNPTDVLEIWGTHLPGQTDANVQVVWASTGVILQYFNGEILRKFTNLVHLDIAGVDLHTIGWNAFDSCGRLEMLFMVNNRLSNIPPQMLGNCGNLKYFWASNGFNLMTIPNDLFGNTRNLETFVINNNHLTSFPDNLLQNMQNLRIFTARNNQLTFLSLNNFANVRNLETFDITQNRFSNPQTVMNLLNGRSSLRVINLSNNIFPMFNFNFFTQFQNLEELAVGGNQNLVGISWQSLPISLRRLTVVEIGEEIPENAFSQLSNLSLLHLTGSGITNIHQNTFRALTRLERLHLTDTRIRTLHPNTFLSQSNLRSLFLNNNEIEELPNGVFAPLVNLGQTMFDSFELSSNRLRRLSSDAFGHHLNLRRISFSRNQINEIHREFFRRFHPDLISANFLGNVCINRSFSWESDLSANAFFQLCFDNFDGITTPTTTTSPTISTTTTSTTSVQTTTPGGSTKNFKKFEIYTVLLGCALIVLINWD